MSPLVAAILSAPMTEHMERFDSLHLERSSNHSLPSSPPPALLLVHRPHGACFPVAVHPEWKRSWMRPVRAHKRRTDSSRHPPPVSHPEERSPTGHAAGTLANSFRSKRSGQGRAGGRIRGDMDVGRSPMQSVASDTLARNTRSVAGLCGNSSMTQATYCFLGSNPQQSPSRNQMQLSYSHLSNQAGRRGMLRRNGAYSSTL